jgi:hypothetical protein
MGDKNVTITLDLGASPVTFSFSGDVSPTNPQAVQIPAQSNTKVKWNLAWINLPAGTSTPRFANGTSDGCNPIVFSGGTEDPWASGSAPNIDRKSDTRVELDDNNRSNHVATLTHYYQVNVAWNGAILTKDPEVDEIGSGGR